MPKKKNMKASKRKKNIIFVMAVTAITIGIPAIYCLYYPKTPMENKVYLALLVVLLDLLCYEVFKM